MWIFTAWILEFFNFRENKPVYEWPWVDQTNYPPIVYHFTLLLAFDVLGSEWAVEACNSGVQRRATIHYKFWLDISFGSGLYLVLNWPKHLWQNQIKLWYGKTNIIYEFFFIFELKSNCICRRLWLRYNNGTKKERKRKQAVTHDWGRTSKIFAT